MHGATTNCNSLDATVYSLQMNDGLLLCDELLCPQNASPFIPCDHEAGHSVIGGWAKHIIGVGQVTTSAVLAGLVGCLVSSLQHSHVEEPFLSCSAAPVARAGVGCTACVGVRERAVPNYSGKFPQHLPWLFELSGNEPH
jgi:hypothetical protein